MQSDELHHVNDKRILSTIHDQKNKNFLCTTGRKLRGISDQRSDQRRVALETGVPIAQKRLTMSNKGKEQALSREMTWASLHTEARAAKGTN